VEKQAAPSSTSLLRGTGIVGSLTLVSRLLGFVEQILIARVFGAGLITDAFFIAYRIPNLLRSFVAEGALTSAFVPVFTGELAKGRGEAEKLLRSVTSFVLLLTAAMSLLGIVFASGIVGLIAPGFQAESERWRLCVTLTRIMFPYIIFVSMVAVINAALNSVRSYGAAPTAQITMNLVLIAATLAAGVLSVEQGVFVLAAATIVGGAAQILVQLPALRRAELRPLPSRRVLTPGTAQMLALMLPAMAGAAIYQIGVFCNSILASLLQVGSVSWLFYADRFSQLPIGVFTVALASVLLPTLSRSAAEGNRHEFEKGLSDSLRYTSFCIIPFSFAACALAFPLTALLYERGQFSSHDTAMTALATQAMCFGLWGVSAGSMVMRAFIARKDTVTPAIIGAGTLLLNIFISVALMGPPETSGSAAAFLLSVQQMLGIGLDYGHVGLALATGLAATLTLAPALVVLDRRSSFSWGPF